ncbi:MAG: hypothetical protein WCF65_08685 [Parachlamydiaceae bacterium]
MFRTTIACLLIASGALFAEGPVLNLMATHEELIHVVSSFEKMDYFSSFTMEGERSWERSFNSKILSWDVQGDGILIFSKDRSVETYYLTCFQKKTGEFVWEKGVYPPQDK